MKIKQEKSWNWNKNGNKIKQLTHKILYKYSRVVNGRKELTAKNDKGYILVINRILNEFLIKTKNIKKTDYYNDFMEKI